MAGSVVVGEQCVEFGKKWCNAVTVEEHSAETTGGSSEKLAGSREIIEDIDFSAEFNGEHWTVEWKWKGGLVPTLRNTASCYKSNLEPEKLENFHKEVQRWIDEEILKP